MRGLVIQNVKIYAPEPLGVSNIFIGGGKVTKVGPLPPVDALEPWGIEAEVVDGKGLIAVPGLIDQHVHFGGAGGEGGPWFRTPPTPLSTFVKGGITTAVGLLGTDGFARSLRELLMKARSLEREGVTARIFTGAYQIPGPLLTSDIASDIMLIDEVIGLKIAWSDHRSSHAPLEVLKEATSQARVGGLLSGKSGVVMVHIGEGPHRLRPLLQAAETTDIPLAQFIPTHLNRSREVFEESILWGKEGGYVDVSAGVSKRYGFTGAVDPAEAIGLLLEEGVPENRITMSSDGNGVMALADPETGKYTPLVSPVKALFEEFVLMVRGGIPMEKALRVVSTNVADHLRLEGKGRIASGGDGDLLLLRQEDLSLHSVVAKGRILMREGSLLKKGLFEE